MRDRTAALLILLLGLLALAGCASTGSGQSDPEAAGPAPAASQDSADYADDAGIEVPDVTGEDGADAVSDLGSAGFEASLADGSDQQDPYFDDSRDATGCETTDQDPSGGDTAAEGDEITVYLDCAQVDWENQEGSVWDEFNEAYETGFSEGCQALFDQSPDGSLYEDDYEYTVTDCESEDPGDASEASDLPVDVPDDPAGAGEELGQLDGCQALFENQSVFSLNYGEDSYTETTARSA